jgi:hypothetical protein
VQVPDYELLKGAKVTNEFDEDLGRIEGLFVDDRSSVPTWVAVRSGLFGSHHSLVPLAESRWDGKHLQVPYTGEDLSIAPHHEPDAALTVDQERELFEHYNVGYGTVAPPGPHTGVDAEDSGLTGSPDAGSHPTGFDNAPADGATPTVPGLPTTDAPRLSPYGGAHA